VPSPKVGCHGTIRDKEKDALRDLASMYGPISSEDIFEVIQVEDRRKLGFVVYVRRAGREELIPVWAHHFKFWSRCTMCHEEGHTRATARPENCAALRHGQWATQ